MQISSCCHMQATMETILLPDTLTMADSHIYEMLAFILSRNVFVLTPLNSKLDWNDNPQSQYISRVTNIDYVLTILSL